MVEVDKQLDAVGGIVVGRVADGESDEADFVPLEVDTLQQAFRHVAQGVAGVDDVRECLRPCNLPEVVELELEHHGPAAEMVTL